MLRSENKSGGDLTTASISTLITFFKPRQVILNSNSNMKHHQVNATKIPFSLTDEQRVLLFQSICQFFEQSGFSKSLKKFSKEAHIEKESWKSCLLNLEEMCYHFLKMRNDTKVSESAIKEQATNQKDVVINHVKSAEKTKKNEGDEGNKSHENIEDPPVDDVKSKKKKKSKSASESSEQISEENHSKPSNEPEDASFSVPNEPAKKSKDKNKKRKEESQEQKKVEKADVAEGEQREKSKTKKKKGDDLKIMDSSVDDTEVDNEKKGSKKRKKSSSEENEDGDVGRASFDDSKRRKIENLDQSNETVDPRTPNGFSNGSLETDEGKESQKKEKSKQHNGSAEPRTAANAFRRVKEEEVEFVDEKLQDNSYWAKDGAETGYGAKAQEVLGQVRGRGFRHEKTKKKRGSYRGGQIDLQSHSFKFNYDDEE